MSNEIVVIGGVEYGTGLDLSEDKLEQYPCFADSGLMLTEEQVRKGIAQPTFRSGRQRFDSTWIRNQGRFGACNGFACASGLERARVLRGLPFQKLSGFGLYAAINGGRDNGSALVRGLEYMTSKGCPPSVAGEKGTFRWADVPAEAKARQGEFMLIEGYRIMSEHEHAVALYRGFPVIVAVQANNRWSQLDGDGVAGPSDGVGNHSVLTDGIRISASGELQMDDPNSWGLQFGQQGRCWLTWKRHLRQTSRNHTFFAITSTSDGTTPLPQLK